MFYIYSDWLKTQQFFQNSSPNLSKNSRFRKVHYLLLPKKRRKKNPALVLTCFFLSTSGAYLALITVAFCKWTLLFFSKTLLYAKQERLVTARWALIKCVKDAFKSYSPATYNFSYLKVRLLVVLNVQPFCSLA